METFSWMLPVFWAATDHETGLVDDDLVDHLWAELEEAARGEAAAERGE